MSEPAVTRTQGGYKNDAESMVAVVSYPHVLLRSVLGIAVRAPMSMRWVWAGSLFDASGELSAVCMRAPRRASLLRAADRDWS